jgi:outer membrane protein assembly factor BamB
MGFLMLLRNITKIIGLTFIIIGCGSSLHIRNFPSEMTADRTPLLTSQMSYDRNMVTSQELKPPLTEDWEEDYQSLPNNGFTTVDNWLLFGMLNGYLAAVDIDDGDLEGKKNLGDACAVPPTVYKNILYQTFESGSNGLIAYDISDGTAIWELEKHLSRSSPIIINDLVLFQSLNGEIIGLHYLSGEEIWRKSLNKSIRNSPSYKNNIMIIVTLDGSIMAIEPKSGDILWESDLDTPVFADPVIEKDKLYIATHTGRLQVINLIDGQLVSHRDFSTGLFNSPTIDQNNIYVTASNGILYSLEKGSMDLEWKFKGEGPICGSALVSNSYIYLATLAGKLYIIDKNGGNQLQKIELVGRARSAPIINQGKLILACEERQVISYVENR